MVLAAAGAAYSPWQHEIGDANMREAVRYREHQHHSHANREVAIRPIEKARDERTDDKRS